jgi:nucleoid DNA-binding protein
MLTPRQQVVADLIAEMKINGTAKLKDFGTFTVKETAARVGRNPRTGEPVQIESGHKIAFKAAKNLKEMF